VLTDAQIERFSRHILLDELGGRGQRRLLAASVRVRRLDVAGRAALLWLARAGVGRLALVVDPARVVDAAQLPDPSGLLCLADAGQPLVEAVSRRLREHHPSVEIVRDPSLPAAGEWMEIDPAAVDAPSPVEQGVRAALAFVRGCAGGAHGG